MNNASIEIVAKFKLYKKETNYMKPLKGERTGYE
jgi:hypothetical protein